MLESFNDSIKKHLANNIWVYIIVISLFIIGTCLGAIAVNTIDETAKADAKTYIDGFIDITANESLQTTFILKQSIKFNLYFAIAAFLSGLIYLGIIIIPVLIAFRGFCIGFSIAFLAESIGKGGFLFSIASILPQNIIYVPVLIMLGVLSLNYSFLTLRNKYFNKYNAIPSQFAGYAFSSLMLLILLLAGCIVEAYITSSLVKVVTSYIK